jgi:hypothetical protein
MGGGRLELGRGIRGCAASLKWGETQVKTKRSGGAEWGGTSGLGSKAVAIRNAEKLAFRRAPPGPFCDQAVQAHRVVSLIERQPCPLLTTSCIPAPATHDCRPAARGGLRPCTDSQGPGHHGAAAQPTQRPGPVPVVAAPSAVRAGLGLRRGCCCAAAEGLLCSLGCLLRLPLSLGARHVVRWPIRCISCVFVARITSHGGHQAAAGRSTPRLFTCQQYESAASVQSPSFLAAPMSKTWQALPPAPHPHRPCPPSPRAAGTAPRSSTACCWQTPRRSFPSFTHPL